MKYTNTEKLKKIQLDPNNYYIVLDFDKTITSKESLDSWMAVLDFEIYGQTCRKEIEKINAKYAPIELDYTLTKEEKEKYMTEWYEKSMDFLYEYQLTYTNLKKALQKEPLKFREGAKGFLQKLQQDNIPVIILSAGIGNVIEEFLKEQKCYTSNVHIISNWIEFEKDKMKPFNKPIIHSMNKNLAGRLVQEVQSIIEQKDYAILCGDLIEDIQMIPKEKEETTIKVGFLNSNIEQNWEHYQKNYDIVLTEEEATFQEVEKIIEERKR